MRMPSRISPAAAVMTCLPDKAMMIALNEMPLPRRD
jgi:hypothetical protein